MGTYESFQTNKEFEEKGITLDLGMAGTYQIARAGGSNKRFLKKMESVNNKHRRAIQANTIESDQGMKIMAEVYASTIILGWTGVTGPDGQPLEYSFLNCVKLLLDLGDLFAEIRQAANDAALYREVILEEDSKNLPVSSSTS